MEKPAKDIPKLLPSLAAIRDTPLDAVGREQVAIAARRIAHADRDSHPVTVAAFNSAV
jgi:broad specificity phosphatase PhoE